MNMTKSYPSLAQSWGLTGIVIGCMLVFTPLNMVLLPIIGKEYAMMVYYIVMMAAAFVMGHFIRKNETNLRGYNCKIESPQLLPFIILAAIGLLIGIVSPVGNLIPMPDMFKKLFKELAEMNGFGAFVTMVIAAPLFEEIIFRGIILDGMLKKYSARKAIFWSAFLFAFVHLNPWQFVTGMVIGGFIGWVYYHTRSLSISIIIHAAVNACGFSLRFIVDEEAMLDQSLVESYGGRTNMILITGSAILIAAVCLFYLHRHFKSKAQLLEEHV
ncbi:CPBP family intramembrane glutamic endopeptidase [Carboxylicivirga marina]|uniref:CPBP family intramembrane glutamic endopeptidase n=1 Tax=Carboxylicivirga marina TaxID=2800988 RepID=UPI002594D236|nr:type II CAAX endopeptidase family protein [uncultured Carboxylicivirga sp.]